jgi:hypothetical protein
MLFQTLDDKSECVGIYCDDKLVFDPEQFPEELTATWKYCTYLKHLENVEYANLYLQGQPVENIIPEYLQDDWGDVSSKIQAFQRSLIISKVDRTENCFFDLVPERYLVDFCRVKNDITKYILSNHTRPTRYDFLLKVCQLLEEISNRRLNINQRKLKSYEKVLNRSFGQNHYISYNQFGTVTGRLTTSKSSFPVLTIRKDMRSVVEPVNDKFLEFDFNGAEARVLMGILGKKQPPEDIHDFHMNEVFKGKLTREQSKTAFFAWLYGARKINQSSEGQKLKLFYDKDTVVQKHWDGKTVLTPLGKTISGVDQHHALNYIVQSTTAELTLLQAIKINHLLQTQGSGSFISCLIHDSIVIDLDDNDNHLVGKVKTLMESTKFGTFGVNISEGKNLGRLEKIEY